MACAAVSSIVWRMHPPHAPSAEAGQGSAALSRCRTNRLSCTCLSSSARSSASAAAIRCSAASSAARASARAWSTWAELFDQQGTAHARNSSLPSPWLSYISLCPYVATPAWRVQPTLNHCVTHPHSAEPSQSSAALPHKQHELHLLVELRALERQRGGQALLNRCLRLSTRLGTRLGARLGARLSAGLSARLGTGLMHLGRLARSARRGTLWGTLAVSAKLTTTCPMLLTCVAVCGGLTVCRADRARAGCCTEIDHGTKS